MGCFQKKVTVPAGCLVLGEASLVWTENPALASGEHCHIQAQNPLEKHPEKLQPLKAEIL